MVPAVVVVAASVVEVVSPAVVVVAPALKTGECTLCDVASLVSGS